MVGSLGRIFTADDFGKQPRGPRLFDFWLAKRPLENPLGPFDVELREPPDEELLRHVNDLVAFVSLEYDGVLNQVYEHYRRTAEDKFWMETSGVPRRLPEHLVTHYLRSRTIVVLRNRNGQIVSTIYLSSRWDVEHGILLGVVNGRAVPQDL